MGLAGLMRVGLARGLQAMATNSRGGLNRITNINSASTFLVRPLQYHVSFRGYSTSPDSKPAENKDHEKPTEQENNSEPDDKKKQAFLESVKAWNTAQEYQHVIKKVEENPKLQTPEVIEEYVKALIARREQGKPELHTLITRLLREPGRTVGNPIFISKLPKSLWERLLYPLLFILFILYLLRGGPLNGFSSKVGEYSNMSKQQVSFDDVKGNDEAKEEMADLVEYLKNPQKFLELGVKMPKGVLLMGPPGTGKTLMARALAGEAKVPFFFASGSEFEEMLVGVGAMRVRNLFSQARAAAPCIVFIDEIDAVGGRRDATESKTKMTLNQLLVELDGFASTQGVLVVAATNIPEVLDPALIRPGRFDRQVHLELPDKKTRHEILEMHLKNKMGDDVNLEVLARHTAGLSGADIFNIANWAAIEAIKHGRTTVTQSLLENALENAVLGRQRKSLIITESTKKLTSFHEAGHALVAYHTPGAQSIHKATLVPRGHALGMVQQLGNDELMYTREELLAALDVAMGGRAAEELIFGPSKVTQGAGSDFQQATRKARVMVTHLGMSSAVGKVYLEKDLSPETQNLVDSEVRKMLDDSFDRAHTLLNNHKAELHRLAEALLEHETLSLEDIKLVIAGKPLPPKIAPLPPAPLPTPLPSPLPTSTTPVPSTPTHAPVIPIPHLPTPPTPLPETPSTTSNMSLSSPLTSSSSPLSSSSAPLFSSPFPTSESSPSSPQESPPVNVEN